MVQLLFASQNKGKVAEVRTLLSPLGLRVFSPEELSFPPDFDVEETGETFAENAELKARAFAQEMRTVAPEVAETVWVLADDSGLAVDALGGRPGVHSKRFAPGTENDRNKAILAELSNLKEMDQRSAHFVAVFCLYRPQENTTTFFEGKVNGHIAFAEIGTAGFGYDSIFIPEGYEETFGQIGLDVKNTLSHRAKAAQKILTFFKEGKNE
jgi:XTP/dITP diphosphohydrolase